MKILRESLPEIIGGLTVAVILAAMNIFRQWFWDDQLFLLIISVIVGTIVATTVLWLVINHPAQTSPKWRWFIVTVLYSALIFYSGWVGTNFELLNQTRLDEARVREVITKDIDAIEEANLSIVDDIYMPDAVVRDCVGTPNTQDDIVNVGIEEIQDRYREIFGWGWKSITLVDLTVSIRKGRATASHKGLVVNGQEFFNHPAKYTLIKSGHRWRITSLQIRCH